MKKGILIAAFLLIGLVGLYRQITAPKITFDEVFSTDPEGARKLQEGPEQDEVEDMSDDMFLYDLRGQKLPSEAVETDGEYYTEGYNVRVYFSDRDKAVLSDYLPTEAMENLNHEIQVYLNDMGYDSAGELEVISTKQDDGLIGFSFQSDLYPNTVFTAYWDGSAFQITEG